MPHKSWTAPIQNLSLTPCDDVPREEALPAEVAGDVARGSVTKPSTFHRHMAKNSLEIARSRAAKFFRVSGSSRRSGSGGGTPPTGSDVSLGTSSTSSSQMTTIYSAPGLPAIIAADDDHSLTPKSPSVRFEEHIPRSRAFSTTSSSTRGQTLPSRMGSPIATVFNDKPISQRRKSQDYGRADLQDKDQDTEADEMARHVREVAMLTIGHFD
ncbi:hypothetical protein PYCC9005_003897 [Savitreella phatthalungensis]